MFDRLSSKITAKSFAGPAQNKIEKCELCETQFDWKHKKHSCKRCQRNICYYCGPDKTIIPQFDAKTPHRICKACKEDQQHQKQLMEVENCKIGQLSNIGKRWILLACGDNAQVNKIQDEYKQQLPALQKNASSEVKNQIQQNLLRLYRENKSILTYSLYDWHYKCCQGEQDNSIVQKLSNVLTCFFSNFPVKLTRNLVFISTYILYFCDEAICAKILAFLHQRVLPQRFQYHKLDQIDETKQIEGEVDFLLQCINEQSGNSVDKVIKAKIKVFLDFNSTSILTTFMFNTLEFYVGYFLFNQLLINVDFSIYEKFLAHICIEQGKMINELQVDEIPHTILKNIQLEQFTTFLSTEDEKKRKYRNSIKDSSQTSSQISQQQSQPTQQQSQIQLNQQNSNKKQEDTVSIDSLLDSLIELVKDNSNQKVSSLLQNQKYQANRNAIGQLIQLITKQKDELDIQKKSMIQLKQEYEVQLEFAQKVDKQLELEQAQYRTSQNSQKSDHEKSFIREVQEKNNTITELQDKIDQQQLLIQRYIEQQQNLELQHLQDMQKLEQKLLSDQENQKQALKEFESKDETYKQEIDKISDYFRRMEEQKEQYHKKELELKEKTQKQLLEQKDEYYKKELQQKDESNKRYIQLLEEDQKKEIQQLKQNQKIEIEEIQKQNQFGIELLKKSHKMELKEQDEANKRFNEQCEEQWRKEQAGLQKEISELRFSNNDLQRNLQTMQQNKSKSESSLKDKIYAEFEYELNKLKEERNQLLKKTSLLQSQYSLEVSKNEKAYQDIEDLKSQIEELKKNSDEMGRLCVRQNEQAEKLTKHNEELNIQIQGLKRKNIEQESQNNQSQTNLTKELQDNNLQLRNQLLAKEKELYSLKCQFVETNQQKIQYFDQMQNYEKENKNIIQKLQMYEQTDLQKMTSFYEEKIKLLEQTHEEQINRLFFQNQQQSQNNQIIFQDDAPQQQQQQQILQQQQQQKEQNQEQIQKLEIQQETTNGQSDDCTIF